MPEPPAANWPGGAPEADAAPPAPRVAKWPGGPPEWPGGPPEFDAAPAPPPLGDDPPLAALEVPRALADEPLAAVPGAPHGDLQEELEQRLADLRGYILSEVDALEDLVSRMPPGHPDGKLLARNPTKKPPCPWAGQPPCAPFGALAEVPELMEVSHRTSISHGYGSNSTVASTPTAKEKQVGFFARRTLTDEGPARAPPKVNLRTMKTSPTLTELFHSHGKGCTRPPLVMEAAPMPLPLVDTAGCHAASLTSLGAGESAPGAGRTRVMFEPVEANTLAAPHPLDGYELVPAAQSCVMKTTQSEDHSELHEVASAERKEDTTKSTLNLGDSPLDDAMQTEDRAGSKQSYATEVRKTYTKIQDAVGSTASAHHSVDGDTKRLRFKDPAHRGTNHSMHSSSVSSFHKAVNVANASRSRAVIDAGAHQSAVIRGRNALQGYNKTSNNAEMFFGVAILTNAMASGVEVQYRANHLGESVPLPFKVIRDIYTLIFLVELIYRVYNRGCGRFLFGDDRSWGWLDVIVVVGGILEAAADITWMVLGTTEEKITGSGVFRNVRLIRIVRITRAFRLQRIIRFVSALRTLVYSIAVTLKSLLWAMILLLIIVYVFGMAFTMEAVDFLESFDPEVDEEILFEMRNAWGTLDRSMFTLFQSISGGVSWRDVVIPLQASSVVPVALFSMYIAFTYFAVLNVVTGVFCSSALETTQRNPDLVARALLDRREQTAKMLSDLFGAIDNDDSGLITIDELESIASDEMVMAYFQALEIDFRDAWTLFKLIDVDKRGCVQLSDFLLGCEQLRGGATNVHISEIAYDVKKLSKKVATFIEKVDSVANTGTGTLLDPEGQKDRPAIRRLA